ncbi:S8 family serine peptidase [Arthrobacter sp. TMN-50]
MIFRPLQLGTVASASVAALLISYVTVLPATAGPQLPGLDAVQEATVAESGLANEPADRFIVKFADRSRASTAERDTAYEDTARSLGIPVEEIGSTVDGATVVEAAGELTEAQADDVVAVLEARDDVEYAEVDVFLRPTAVAPNDSLYGSQWNLFEGRGGMRVDAAWPRSTGEGVTVAVIDSGITAHSDLAGNLVAGYDFISSPEIAGDSDGRDPDPADEGDWCESEPSSWHGTHVAGTIGALANNAEGIAGVAFGAKIQAIRALGACGGYTSDVAAATLWAAGGAVSGVPVNPTPAKVINLSLGGDGACGPSFQAAINYAVSRNVVVVAAAGNARSLVQFTSPANCDNVIVVGATGREGNQANYSNYGPEVDVSAPGGDASTGLASAILSTVNNGVYAPAAEGYGYKQGTSMATPHVAGAAALMLAANPALTAAQVEAQLKATVRPLPGSCYTGGCGTGLVDAAAAVASVAPAIPDLASATPMVTGQARVGGVLSASAGVWGPAPVSLAYQWLRGGTPIPGATQAKYTVAAGDTGAKLSVRVTGTKPGYNSAIRTSQQTAAVTNSADDVVTPVPTIQGTPQVGKTLTATPGEWKPAPVQLTYQWLRNGSPITGASAPTYTPGAADLNRTLKIRVTGSGTSVPPTERTSAATAAVVPGVLQPTRPVISGAAAVGSSLVAEPGVWGSGTTFSFQWLRNGSAISGATTPAYRPTGDDISTRLSVQITGTRPGYTTVATTSTQTQPIPRPFRDVPATMQFQDEMSWMAAEGISTGWRESDGTRTYRPLTTVNRDAMAAFMYRMAGSPAFTPPTTSPFADVSTTQQFYKEMAWLAKSGISTGWNGPNGTKTYRALTPVNRDAMAVFMYRMAGSPAFTPPTTSPFADVSTTQQFYKEMAWLAKRGISTGWNGPNGTKTYRALTPVNRDAMAVFMYRFSRIS